MGDPEQFDAASVAIFSGSSVLLMQRAMAPYRGFWTLPGGRVQDGETAEACVQREVFEELGLQVRPQFVVRHEARTAQGLFALAVFASSFRDGSIRSSREVLQWNWVDLPDIGTFRATPDLQRIVELASRTITAA